MEKNNFTVLHDEQRNRLIKHLYPFPKELEENPWRVKGDVTALLYRRMPRVAILGVRDPFAQDIEIIRKIVRSLAKNKTKPVILSGLAVGTDTEVHRSAIANGLPTYAVLPSGLDNIYPQQNTKLADKIVDAGGGLISWYKDGTMPTALNFLQRTNFLVTMCDAVIIVTAREKGTPRLAGTLAYDLGIPCYAVPGPMDDKTHAGCLRLIKTRSAEVLTSFEELENIF